MYFIMISQQNCNLQRAMSHTTPTAPSSLARPPPCTSLHARFLRLVHFLLPPPRPSSRVLSISLAPIISTVLSIRLSPLASSSDRPSRSNRVSRSTHTCKPSLTSDSKELLSSSPLSSLLSHLAPQIAILFALILALSLSSFILRELFLYPLYDCASILFFFFFFFLQLCDDDATAHSLSLCLSLIFSKFFPRAPKSCISCPPLLAHRLTRPSWDSISDQLRGVSR